MILEPVDDDIWIAEGRIIDFYSFPYPTRAVLVRLPRNRLWVWSPVALTEELRTEVNRIGKVTYLVSPNPIHHLYLQDWKAAYPAATLWGLGQTIAKRKDLDFEAPLSNNPPDAWAGLIDQIVFAGSLMDEVVFFHRASRTAIFADLTENFSETFLRQHWSGWKRVVARLAGIVEGKGYAPIEWRLTWFNRRPARAALDTLLAWEPERVIMAHGEWQASGGTQYLRQAFKWLR